MVAEPIEIKQKEKKIEQNSSEDALSVGFSENGHSLSDNGFYLHSDQDVLQTSDDTPDGLSTDMTLVYDKPIGHYAHLPPLDWESGYREYYDKKLGKVIRTPITLSDIIYPVEGDIGEVKVAQSVEHSEWVNKLRQIIETYVNDDPEEETWLILQDVLIYWENREERPRSPDITAIPRGKRPKPPHQSYRVGRDGPIPAFVVEITSKETRSTDLDVKPDEYAARGIREYLIIDVRTPRSQDWELIGYVLENDGKTYRKITPDAEGGIAFEHIGMRFVSVGRKRVDVYDTETDEELLGLSSMKQFADTEAERADAEAERAKTEAERADALEKKLNAEAQARKAEAQARKEAEEELALLRAQLGKDKG